MMKSTKRTRLNEFISAEETVRLRIKHGEDSRLSNKGNYVAEEVLYVPRRGRFIIKQSLIIESPLEFAEEQKYGREFYIPNELIEDILDESVHVPYKKKEILARNLGNDEVSTYIFGEQAESYGQFLEENGINEIPIYLCGRDRVTIGQHGRDYIDWQDEPFVRRLWLYNLDCRSGLGP